MLWAELAAAGWERTALAAGAALLLGEDAEGGTVSPALAPGSASYGPWGHSGAA